MGLSVSRKEDQINHCQIIPGIKVHCSTNTPSTLCAVLFNPRSQAASLRTAQHCNLNDGKNLVSNSDIVMFSSIMLIYSYWYTMVTQNQELKRSTKDVTIQQTLYLPLVPTHFLFELLFHIRHIYLMGFFSLGC